MPINGAIRPATSLIGARSGSELSSWRTVSYAMATLPAATSASVQARDAARWR